MNRRKMKMFAVSAMITLLGTVLISSGICGSEIINDFSDSEVKILTRQDTGILLLSAIFTKDVEVRIFLVDVVQELLKSGELEEKQIQNIANNAFSSKPEIFLFGEVNDIGEGVILPIPGTIKSFVSSNSSFSILISQTSDLSINHVVHDASRYILIGFYGQAYNYSPSRPPKLIDMYHVSGTSLITLIF